MTLPGKVIQSPVTALGFDCNEHVTQAKAQQFRSDGYRFCLRYVPRRAANPGDITRSEAAGILAGGLALMLVQHVQRPPWVPTPAMGQEYGAFAAASAEQIGYLPGAMLWCDLEGVDRGVPSQQTIKFLNNWSDQVGHAGYTPGLYVGYDPGVSADQLYRSLKYEHYWSAYNLNRDQFPAVRGVQMLQGIEKVVHGIKIDPDTIQVDHLGGLPLMHVDNEWTP